jgi:hypothetical protein
MMNLTAHCDPQRLSNIRILPYSAMPSADSDRVLLRSGGI